MNIYLVKRTDEVSYDEFDSFVCVAESEDMARNMKPVLWGNPRKFEKVKWEEERTTWARGIKDVTVHYLGKAAQLKREPQIVCASFNAG